MRYYGKLLGGTTLAVLLAGCGSSNNSQTPAAGTVVPGSSTTLAKNANAYAAANEPGAAYNAAQPTPAVDCVAQSSYCLMTPGPLPAAALAQLELAGMSQSGLNATVLASLQGTGSCDVAVYRIEYTTHYPSLSGPNNAAQPSAVVMIPSPPAGASATVKAQCGGSRPIVEYAHGTAVSKNFDMAQNFYDLMTHPTTPTSVAAGVNDGTGEASLLAADFAAQGYIVVAPNYAGYNTDALTPYHPYINAAQESQDMLDALTAGRQVIKLISSATTMTIAPNTPIPNPDAGVADSGSLYVTGYSEGGFVAMATLQHLQALGQPVKAGAALSGPYATEAFGDTVFNGAAGVGSTIFASMMLRSYENLSQGALPSLLGTTKCTQTGSATCVFSADYSGLADSALPAPLTYSQITANSGNPSPSTDPCYTAAPSATAAVPTCALFDGGSTYPDLQKLNAYQDPLSGGPSPFLAGQGLSVDTLNPNNPLSYNPYFLVNDAFRENYLQDEAKNPDGAGSSVTTYDTTNNLTGTGLGGMTGLGSFTDTVLTNPTSLATYFQSANLNLAPNPQNPLRAILKANDLRNYVPQMPLLMCGGSGDPTVFFLQNSALMFGKIAQSQASSNPVTAPVVLADVGMPEQDVPTLEANQALQQSSAASTYTAPSINMNMATGNGAAFNTLLNQARAGFLGDMQNVFDTFFKKTPDGSYANQIESDIQYAVMNVAFQDAFNHGNATLGGTGTAYTVATQLTSYWANLNYATPVAPYTPSATQTPCIYEYLAFSAQGTAAAQLAAAANNVLGCAVIQKTEAALAANGMSLPTYAALVYPVAGAAGAGALAGVEVGATTATASIDLTMVLGAASGVANGIQGAILQDATGQLKGALSATSQDPSATKGVTVQSDITSQAQTTAEQTVGYYLVTLSQSKFAGNGTTISGIPALSAIMQSTYYTYNFAPTQAAQAKALASGGATFGVQSMLPKIHGTAEPPYCMALAEHWFQMYQ
ncbi:MAG: hypothetical protein HKM02_12740 [Pseudomonadales bacterium]|nr:hypothetical protein [Pseudomonadales bacterium]